MISLIDLCGHEKYLKTTIFGLSGTSPDYAMIIVGANMGVQRMTIEHIGIAFYLKIPFYIIITKIDICPKNILKQTMANLNKILKKKKLKKVPMLVKEKTDISEMAKKMSNNHICPIF